MSNRILKESICTSDSIDTLSWFEEVTFYRLIVNCDDFGRIDGRPPILRSRLFPLKTITDKQIGSAINKLTSAGLVMPYKYDGKAMLQIVAWDEHQLVRNKKGKVPAANGRLDVTAKDNIFLIKNNLQQIATDCNKLQQNVARIQSNPIQYESVSEYESKARDSISLPEGAVEWTPAPLTTEDLFIMFWEEYPRKQGKKDAHDYFVKKLKPTQELVEKMIAAVKQAKKSKGWQDKNGQFIPLPATWLRGERWEDDVQEQKVNVKDTTFNQYIRRGEIDYSSIEKKAQEKLYGGG